MKKTLQLLVGLIMVISSTSCKKDKSSSSGSKMELLTEKPWALVSQEIFNPTRQVWELLGGEANRLHYFYADGTVEKKNSSSGTPSTYPVVGRGTWSFADGEKALNHTYFSFMKSPVVIETLTSTKFVIITTENTVDALKYRNTYAHP